MIAMPSVSGGIVAMLFSAFLFAIMGAEAKILGNDMPPLEIAFFRAFTMIIFLLPFMINKPIKLPTQKSGGYLILFGRAFAGAISFAALFYNIATISLGSAIAFAQSMPIYIVILSFLFLRQRISFSIIIFTLIGFIGVMLICNPNINDLNAFNVFMGILSGLGMAIAFLNLQALKHYFSPNFIILCTGFAMCFVVILLSFLPYFSALWIMPSGFAWIHILLMGLFGTLGQEFLTKAYMNAPAGIIAPIDYTRLLFSIVLGIILGDAFPHLLTLLGLILIIISGVGIGLPALLQDIRTHKFSSK